MADYYLKREDKENRVSANDSSEIVDSPETNAPEAAEEKDEHAITREPEEAFSSLPHRK